MFTQLAKHKETTGGFDFEEKSKVQKWYQHQKILINRLELPKDKVDILAAIGVNHQPKYQKRENHEKRILQIGMRCLKC